MTQHEIDTTVLSARRRRAEEAADSISVMRLQEESDAYRRVDYLAAAAAAAALRNGNNGDDQQQQQERNERPKAPQHRPAAPLEGRRPVDAECRRKMCDWSLKVVDYCDFNRETVSVAMTYLDRFLSSAAAASSSSSSDMGNSRAYKCLTCRREYQLASMTSLYLAVKLHEPLLTMDAEHVSDLSRGSYSAREVVDMERDMLDALMWRTADPTPLAFLSRLVALLPTSSLTSEDGASDDDDKEGAAAAAAAAAVVVEPSAEEVLLEMGRAQTELAAAEYDFVRRNASVVAVAALVNSVEAAGDILLSTDEASEFLSRIEDATGIDLTGDDVADVRSRLRELLGENDGGDGEGDDADEVATACSTASTAEETAPETDTESETESEAEPEAVSRSGLSPEEKKKKSEPVAVVESSSSSSVPRKRKCVEEPASAASRRGGEGQQQSLLAHRRGRTTQAHHQEEAGVGVTAAAAKFSPASIISHCFFGLGRTSVRAVSWAWGTSRVHQGGAEVLSLL